MRPPICEVCDDDFDPGGPGGLLHFRKGAAGATWDERAQAPGFTGHAPYAGWFCGKHIDMARALTHLELGEALRKIG